MTPRSRTLVVHGVGLHTGEAAHVTLRAEPGPVRLRSQGIDAAVADLAVVSTERSTTVAAAGGRLRIRTVEHLFAALAGMGIHEGVAIEVDGPEIPLLDGGSAAWCDAIQRLGLTAARSSAPARVARAAVVTVGSSRYEFRPGDRILVEVHVDFDDARLHPDVRWTGDAADFRDRIAPARTFARAGDVAALVRAGLARHVEPESVVVLASDAVHHAGRPFSPDEPARHKLLDLVGDLYLRGGPPLGRVSATRPGHGASAEAFSRAAAEGILVRT